MVRPRAAIKKTDPRPAVAWLLACSLMAGAMGFTPNSALAGQWFNNTIGSYLNSANWIGGVPTASEPAQFTQGSFFTATHGVIFGGNTESGDLIVGGNNVLYEFYSPSSQSAVHAVRGDIELVGNGFLTLGLSTSTGVQLIADGDLLVTGARINVTNGSEITAESLSIQNLSSNPGAIDVFVSGIGSGLEFVGEFVGAAGNTIGGEAGLDGSLTVTDGATARFADRLSVGGGSTAGSLGRLIVSDGAVVTLEDVLVAGGGSADSQLTEITVTGAGSLLDQTLQASSFTDNLSIGSPTPGLTNNRTELNISELGRVSASGQNTRIFATATVNIETGGTFDGNGVLRLNGGTINLSSGSLRTGTFTNNNGTFNHTGGTLQVDGGVYSPDVSGVFFVSGESGQTATIELANGASHSGIDDNVVIGRTGSAELRVLSGSEFGIPNSVFVGDNAGVSGEVLVQGSGSTFNAGSLRVGERGNGTFQIGEQATATISGNVAVGVSAGSTGRLDIVGAGTTLSSSAVLVGAEGEGELSIANGGSLSGFGGIGTESGSTGTATVTGSGSSWTSFGGLEVGRNGTGTLNISDDGLVSVSGTTSINSASTLSLSGGSLTTNSFDNSDGGTFNHTGGTLTVDGGTLTGVTTILGPNDPVVVLDNGATTVPDTTLVLGGGGELRILNGSSLNLPVSGSRTVLVGTSGGGTGSLTVDSATATFTSVLVSETSSANTVGVVNVQNGGILTSTGQVGVGVGGAAGTQAIVTVEGSGSEFNHTGMSNISFGRTAAGANNFTTVNVLDNGRFSTAANLSVRESATFTIDSGGELAVDGDLELTQGTINLNDGSLTTGSFDNSNGGVLNLNGGTLTTGSFDDTNGGSFNHDDGELVINGGTLSVSGILRLSGGGNSGDSPILTFRNGATSSLPAQLIIGTPNNAAELNIESGAQVATTNSGIGGRVLIGASEGGGSINVTGTNSLLAAGGRLEFRSGTDILVGEGASATAVEDLALGGSLVLDGTVTVGTVATISSSGRILGNGTLITSDGVTNSGVVAPGESAGTLTVDGDYVQQASGTLEIELGGTAPGDSDLFKVTGTPDINIARFGGTLDLSLVDSYAPGLGDRIEFLQYVFLTGVFDNIQQPAGLPAELAFTVDYFPTFAELVLAPTLTGDFNADGRVDAADYTVWRDSLDSTTNLAADANRDGIVNQADYNAWASNFGATLPPATAAIPEPTSGVLLLVLAAVGTASRRR